MWDDLSAVAYDHVHLVTQPRTLDQLVRKCSVDGAILYLRRVRAPECISTAVRRVINARGSCLKTVRTITTKVPTEISLPPSGKRLAIKIAL